MSPSSTIIVPAFSHHILRIVFACTYEQVSRIKAHRIITTMANAKIAVQIKSVENKCAQSVNTILYPINFLRAIAKFCLGSFPMPATVRLNFSICQKSCPYSFRSFKRQLNFFSLKNQGRTVSELSHVMLMTKSLVSSLSVTFLHSTKPFARLIQRIHTQTLSLNGEIRKGLLSLPQFS